MVDSVVLDKLSCNVRGRVVLFAKISSLGISLR